MKIFLPFEIRGIGGTSTFAKKFQEGMQKHGHEVFFRYQKNYDVLFLVVQAPFKYLIEAKRRNIPIIQRLDGTYYWSVSGWKFPLYNLKAAIIRHSFADFTLYQSEYSKYCAKKFLGKKHLDPSVIIYNGTDLDLFSPKGETINLRDTPDQKIFFTASAFRREDQIIPLFHALKAYREKYGSNFKFLIAGTFSGKVSDIPKRYQDFREAIFLGKIENADLPKYERSADVFLFTHLNPPCPNNVIEALACGLPICGVADGSMSELITPGKNGELASAKGSAFWKERIYDPVAFADNIQKILDHREVYSENARLSAEKNFSLNAMIADYEKALSCIP